MATGLYKSIDVFSQVFPFIHLFAYQKVLLYVVLPSSINVDSILSNLNYAQLIFEIHLFLTNNRLKTIVLV